ncbi:MAG: hypothetical protein HZB61_08430 [Nitrospirae bacterium]|nr:hypothetical protein [Nitrospirota bacterium]
MNRKSKVILTSIMFIALMVKAEFSRSQDINDYTAYPPFVSQQTPPNVMIMLDESGSMNEFAYKTPGDHSATISPDASFNPATTYYGYFDSTKKYSYSALAGGHFYQDAAGTWNGNFMNWLTMRRMDVVRKVLIGGKAIPRISGSPNYLLVNIPDRDYYKKYAVASTYAPFTNTRCFRNSNGNIAVSTKTDGTCSNFTAGTYNIKVKFSDTEEPLGVVQKTRDRIRFGLMYYNNSGSKFESGGGGNYDGGYVQDNISGPGTNVNLITSIENTDPLTWTPLGETLYEATRFFRATTGAYRNANYSAAGVDPQQYDCQKNFVLILTDGESTMDRNLPGGNWNSTAGVAKVADPMGFDVGAYMDLIAANEGTASQKAVDANTSMGTYYLEGVAYWAHITDLRPTDWAGTQNITTYAVFAFDDSPVGRDLLKKTAKYGGFRDYNANNKPDLQNEWDEDGNGVPDTYFEAQEGALLESSLLDALTDILRRASSGTAVSVLATTGEGEGAVYQAYFYPEKLEKTDSRKWLGYLQALFVDKYGNLREDFNANATLDMTSDYIVEMEYSAEVGTTIKRYTDADGDGEKDSPDNPAAIVALEDLKAIWKGGDRLWQTPAANRTIFTTTDGFNTITFNDTNKTTLKPYVRAADDTESANIINWIRGDDLTGIIDAGHASGYRKRSITINNVVNVWKLGDVIYSTPTVVGRPMENYDLLYGDSTYTNFRTTYLKRRNVVFVGSNDGMLHAFNGGFYNSGQHKFCTGAVDNNGNCTVGTYVLGDELWSFIPRGLLPHLKWDTLPTYTHVYYVDLKPKVTDVKMFNADDTHPDGWGTILIGGFRYGGKHIKDGNNIDRYPEYFALDITDPLNPRLLWTFTSPVLGLSMSYPAVAKVGGEWFAIFGSGASSSVPSYDGNNVNGYDVNSNLTAFQNGNVFVLKMSGGAHGVISAWTENTNYWKISTGNATTFMADPISVDVDMDNDVDVMYIGENNKQGNNWNTRLKRITTNKGTEGSPALWSMSTFADISTIAGTKDVVKRITAAPSAAMDDKANLYVYFGTGQYLGSDDKNQTDTGAFYGIKDGCWDGTCSLSFSNLLDVSAATVMTDDSVSGVSGNCGAVNTWSDLLTASSTCDGWAMYFKNLSETVDFNGTALKHNGERVNAKPLVLGGLVIWASYIPGISACSYEGDSNVYAVYYKTGTAYKDFVFSTQNDLHPNPNPAPPAVIDRVMKLGVGMPSSLSAQIISQPGSQNPGSGGECNGSIDSSGSSSIKGFAQQSTGVIQQLESITPVSLKSGLVGWKSEEIK